MKKEVNLMSKLAILSISTLILGAQAISPAMAGIIQAFPKVPVSTCRMVISLPLITLVLTTLITGRLEAHFDKKAITLAGIAVYTVAGTVSVFSANFPMLVICRLLIGVGLGMFASYAVAFLSILFEGDERRKMIGLQSTATNVGSLVLTTAASILTTISWNTTFYIYLAGVIVFVLVALFVPSFPPVKGGKHRKTGGMTKALWKVSIGNFLYFIAFFIVFSDFSVLIMTSGLGSAHDGGTGLSLLNVSALIVSALYRQISDKLKKLTAPVGIGFTAAGFLIAGNAASLAVANFSALVIGIGFGVIMPHCYACAAASVDGPRQPLAAAAQTFATNIASFCSAYALTFVLAIIGGEVAERTVFIGIGILMIVYAAVTTAMAVIRKEE
ncbi:MAG: MFS transporter [Faecousia sp.]